jgi:hypothetical protein
MRRLHLSWQKAQSYVQFRTYKSYRSYLSQWLANCKCTKKNSQAMTLSSIKPFLFAAAVSAVTFLGCDTTENVPPDNTPHPEFKANINGTLWSVGALDSLDQRIYANKLVVGKLVLNASRNTDGTSDNFMIRVSSPQEGVNILRPSLDQNEQTARYIPATNSDSVFAMTASDSGQVVIDHYDETTTRISGTFWFTATNKDQKLSVTSGSFKDMIIRQ